MALGTITYKWGDSVATVEQDAENLLGIRFRWQGKTPATFTRARMQEVEPEFRTATRPRLPEDRFTLKRELDLDDTGDAYWIADILSLFNIAARARGIITRTASPDFSFRTTPPDYSLPEVVFPNSSERQNEQIPN